MNHKSIKLRFLAALTGNGLSAALGFASGIMLARMMGPEQFGAMSFLLASFTAMRALTDPGVSSAYFTFISKREESLRLHLTFALWLALTAAAVMIFILLCPAWGIERIWLAQPKNLILLAFLSIFMRQTLWQSLSQAGEAARNTVWVQAANVIASALYVMIIGLLWYLDKTDMRSVLLLSVLEYAVMSAVALCFLRGKGSFPLSADRPDIGSIIKRFWNYCQPLVILAFFSFAYDFLDRWFLQKFAGSAQQGFFQVAFQFSAVSLLAVRSMLNIFWKEIAEAHHDDARVAHLFNRTTKMLVFVSAAISGMLIPWSKEITVLFLSADYIAAWPVMAVMFLYPIYQSAGQITAVTFNACENNAEFTRATIFTLIAGTAAAYIFLAPSTAAIPGMGLGAMGLAVKMLLITCVGVNTQIYILTRLHNFRFDWRHQFFCIAIFVGLGYILKLPFMLFTASTKPELLALMAIYGLMFSAVTSAIVFKNPGLAGSSEEELSRLRNKILSLKFKTSL